MLYYATFHCVLCNLALSDKLKFAVCHMFAVRADPGFGSRGPSRPPKTQAHIIYGVMYGCPLPIGGGVWGRGHTYWSKTICRAVDLPASSFDLARPDV